eukprot:Nitzschia sp. Nitz4//scaffold247_size31676//11422//13657//NITZ4_007928-RA/size31676-processed-gene-0.33-mRNA-1//1//CDS//3329543949//6413//frame0
MTSEPWKDCHLKEYQRRKGRDWYSTNRDRRNVNSTFLHQHVDIVGGHFKIGTLDHLTTAGELDKHGRHHRHVVFFRDAAAKYVSGKIFVQTTHHPKSENNMEIILEKIQKEVDHAARAPGTSYHQKYGDYLLTPTQLQTCHDQKCSVKEKADLIKKNLLDYNVTVGIVEKMKESMDVLHHVMEPHPNDPQTRAFYRKFATSKSRNVSPISTRQVMQELKKIHNGTTYTNMLEFVRYEQEITDFAMKLHKWQYAKIEKLRSVLVNRMSIVQLKHTVSIVFGFICVLLSLDLQLVKLAESPDPIGESDYHHPSHLSNDQVSTTVESYGGLPSKWLPTLEASIQPLNWNCSTDFPATHKSSILVFVHVFKTAGSTMRNFFQQYGQRQCPGSSCATLISCTNATIVAPANGDNTWANCKMKNYLNRQGDVWQNSEKSQDNVNSTFLRDRVDIVGGHFRIGRLDHVVSDTPRNLRHVAFFRDAAAKYVSGVIFMQTTQYRSNRQRRKPSIKSVIEQIQQEVDNTDGFHKKYADYLLTPSQMQTCLQQTCSAKEMADIVKENLIQYNVTVGVVERMRESMDVLYHVMEPQSSDPETRVFYQSFASSKSRNVSPISTSQVMDELKSIRNGTTYANMLQYVRYEQEITDFALQLHERQYALVQDQRTKLS